MNCINWFGCWNLAHLLDRVGPFLTRYEKSDPKMAQTEATAMIFIWGHRGYPPVRFEYKTAFGGFIVDQILKE